MSNDTESDHGVDPRNPAAVSDDSGLAVPRRLRRRRSFVASNVARDAKGIRARLASAFNDDDLPVLTEVVEPDGGEVAGGAEASAWLGLVEHHLSEVLPGLLQAALADAGQRLQQRIEAEVAQTLRQFADQHSAPMAVGREIRAEAAADD